MTQFDIPDKRSTDPKDYEHLYRRGRMKKSWELGVQQQERQMVSFMDGLTWGSIGQLLGYLFGKVDEEFQDELYERLENQYKLTDRGKRLR
jgi:hypothetical protein